MGLPLGAMLKGRYRILARLGEGGMGSVYQVEDTRRPGVPWAMKELLDDLTAPPDEVEQAKKRFDDEIALMKRLHHPLLPTYHDDFTDGGKRFFVMEFIPGSTLEERLAATSAPLPERDVLRWMIGICDALAYLHGQKPPIIMRDLKPGNIMITPDGNVRLIDLGIARTYKPGQLSNTENLGTMTYASPEHLGRTQTNALSDIYSLGATMYHLLTHHEPAPLETPMPGGLRRYAPALSEATEAAVIRAMDLDPAHRFQSASEMRAALARCLALLAPPAPQRASKPVSTSSGVGAHGVRPPASRPPAPAPRPAASPSPSPAAKAPAVTVCPRCGHRNRPTARFCAHDGTPLVAGAVPHVPVAPVVMRAPVTRATTATLSIQLANEAYAARRYGPAVHQCRSAIALNAGDCDIYMLLGRSLQALGQFSDAAEAFGEAARLRPTLEALKLEGSAAYAAARYDLAQIAFTRARALDGQDPALCYQLALVTIELGQLAQAEGDLRDALALRSKYPEAEAALKRVLALRKAAR
ncbi:MAG: Serine/threonine protein kinase PrkC, regulator of stationary phase [Ktedonobacterales bacterium]|jgi:tetratricopeptide (TPR) repeat protein|nr:MAG: Serine/threonine protein kinase PrkC, regulator of stationary phase [Ktedonobacterales bacterium]